MTPRWMSRLFWKSGMSVVASISTWPCFSTSWTSKLHTNRNLSSFNLNHTGNELNQFHWIQKPIYAGNNTDSEVKILAKPYRFVVGCMDFSEFDGVTKVGVFPQYRTDFLPDFFTYKITIFPPFDMLISLGIFYDRTSALNPII